MNALSRNIAAIARTEAALILRLTAMQRYSGLFPATGFQVESGL